LLFDCEMMNVCGKNTKLQNNRWFTIVNYKITSTMPLEQIARILIIIHAATGGIALLAGAVALAAKKGRLLHRRSGFIFFCTMLLSVFLAMIIAVLPEHKSPFLFAIGVFSAYLLLSGYGNLKYKTATAVALSDKIVSWGMILAGVGMIFYGLAISPGINYVLLVFGVLGIWLAMQDVRLYAKIERLRQRWLRQHLSRMAGGYIASITAFLVVNELIPGLWAWFVPTILGSVFIAYWMRKVRKGEANLKIN